MTQPGYDAVADLYSEALPTPYQTPLERHVVGAFADLVLERPLEGIVLDVGCGLGHVTADLAGRGLDVVGIDPSREMLGIARRNYPELRFVHDDAQLESTDLGGQGVAAVVARFSLIHLPPSDVPNVLAGWAARMAPGALVAVAGQTTDTVGEVSEFDHAVAQAWRWHPDRLSEALSEAGFEEVWRTISRPDAQHRFPEVHLVARRRYQV
ncbi:class I SAM-dependent methyltransferase [Rhodococcus spongiicola]|uniref:Class I SAM-dependent methyltransferase n=1 Tax=Rhodococcus spongiicola TaxID=2487352 RepID=A0A438AXW0_9NOCA|nr:class I SAM-dependent methyltransferase [Rhodococcus spongiicola]RVW03551.1 class I SAM-dependent methyltransferase [Rhodococcus spongiicola]